MKNRKGFTLIEISVVVLIIGVLTAIALPQYYRAVEKSTALEALLVLDDVAKAEQRHYLATNEYTNKFSKLDLDFANLDNTGETITTDKFTITIDSDERSVIAERNGGKYAGYIIKKYFDPENIACIEGNSKPVCDILGIKVEEAQEPEEEPEPEEEGPRLDFSSSVFVNSIGGGECYMIGTTCHGACCEYLVEVQENCRYQFNSGGNGINFCTGDCTCALDPFGGGGD